MTPELPSPHPHAWSSSGKWLHERGQRVTMRAVCYGPFPPHASIDHRAMLRQMRMLGFNSLRCYQWPSSTLLDAAALEGIAVFAGLSWGYGHHFIHEPRHLSAARVLLQQGLKAHGQHPALRGIYVANEIPADLVRGMGPQRVLEALDLLILEGKSTASHLLFAYANYPSTEYLEPAHADFTAMNVYLERADDFSAYLQRLHHIAGDRPLVISEFGLDALRHGDDDQARVLEQGCLTMLRQHVAGLTIFSWSDLWWNQQQWVTDWQFGLHDANGFPRASAHSLQRAMQWHNDEQASASAEPELFSIIICTRNGRHRIGACLDAVARLHGRWEAIVIDDGSSDGTAEFIARFYPWVRLQVQAPSGLSVARNQGAALARGSIYAYTDDDCQPDREWITCLAEGFSRLDVAAIGGPNIPPAPSSRHAALIAATEGSAAHVMLDDLCAEHLPGCNFAIKRHAFERIGGFRANFHTAGDDVDLCWRLLDAGFLLGFAPCAFVWHQRRTSIRGYWKQQWHYGLAEAQLIEAHPHRFRRFRGASWQGRIYFGGPIRSTASAVIYHGPWGTAPYQTGVTGMLPQRPISAAYNDRLLQYGLKWVNRVARLLRYVARNGQSWSQRHRLTPAPHATQHQRTRHDRHEFADDFVLTLPTSVSRLAVLAKLHGDQWEMAASDDFDLQLGSVRLSIAQEQPTTTKHRLWFRLTGSTADVQFARTSIICMIEAFCYDTTAHHPCADKIRCP